MGTKRKIMNTVSSWDRRSCPKNEKEGPIAVRILKKKRLTGRGFKERLRSLTKTQSSDPSIQKKRKLSEISANEANGSKEDKTTNSDSSVSHSQQDRVVFMLRRVKNSSNAEKSKISNDATQTKLQQRRNNIVESQCNDGSKLQEKFANSVAAERKSITTNFVEYWVPVRLSNVQTEQYCCSMFSNSGVLCSSLKLNRTETLREILVSTRKCCDHPYLADSSTCASLVQDIPEAEKLDTEIKLSSKLLLLHKILQEISKRGLRVVILYQTLGGSGPISIGDILDDIIHEKFGEDSFVRIGEGISKFKTQAVLNTFNDKESGRFVCLMETRACVPSIKLKSIDTVVFFNSDWDPMNDLRALQKIDLDSQFEHVKVFRLYSAYTVEEKLLMLAKQGTSPEGNILTMKQSTCRGLLTWGAYYLFEKLDEFHSLNNSDTHPVISYGDSFVEDVFLELSILLPNNEESSVRTNNSFILEVRQIGGSYPGNISLLGEVEYPLMNNFSLVERLIVKEPQHVFWINLLQGRDPSWKILSSKSSRTRKCVQGFYDILKASVRASKKCRREARTRSLSELQSQDNERKLPGEAADPTTRQAPILGSPCPMEPDSLASAYPLIDDSLEHPIEEVHMQTACIASNMNEDRREPITTSQTNVSLSSLNFQPPEASQLTHPGVIQSVCKELQMEMERLQNQHEDMKLQAKMAREKEIDEIHKKYEMVLQKADMALAGEREVLITRYNKVFINKSLPEAMMQREISENADLPRGQQITGSSSMHNLPITYSANLQPGYQMRAPAPHLRHMVRPLPITSLLLPSHHPEITFSSVSLQQVMSNIQTRRSLGRPSSSPAEFAP